MITPGIVTGGAILLHAVYSSYEWVHLHKLLGSSPDIRIPRDVAAEAVVGLALIVLSAISWATSGMKPIKVADLNATKTLSKEEPYAYLENRPNFQDLVGKRKAYLDWKLQAATDKKQAAED